MNWTELKITVPKKTTEQISNVIIASGINNFAVDDFDDFEDVLGDSKLFYDYIEDSLFQNKDKDPVISVYFPDNTQGRDSLEYLKSELNKLRNDSQFSTLEYSLSGVREEDWENNWKKYFKPFTVGEKLVVKPSWETLSDEMKNGRCIIELDPGSSFGTGTHATTRLCLSCLEKHIDRDTTMLDMGTGSGILAIGALSLGAKRVVAVDIDENAARIAKENLDINSHAFSSKDYTVLCGNVLEDNEIIEKITAEYDVICANIVAGVIIMMAPLFKNLLGDSGILIASGIIGPRAGEVLSALLEEGFKLIERHEDEDWAALEMIKQHTL